MGFSISVIALESRRGQEHGTFESRPLKLEEEAFRHMRDHSCEVSANGAGLSRTLVLRGVFQTPLRDGEGRCSSPRIRSSLSMRVQPSPMSGIYFQTASVG